MTARRVVLVAVAGAVSGIVVATVLVTRGGDDGATTRGEQTRVAAPGPADEPAGPAPTEERAPATTDRERADATASAAAPDGEPPTTSTADPAPPPPDVGASEWRTDFSRRSVPLEEIQSGGPPKDGIPALDDPSVVPVDRVDFLEDREPVIAVQLDGVARAYPIRILVWHEIVNDVIAGRPVAVTFCPLCNTAIVFDRRLDGRVLDFGTTGRLRNSDLVMYDRQTESWWQQFSGEAIVGELTGARLEQVAAVISSWADFRADNPEGEVLSDETGFSRPYGRNPYQGYDDVSSPPFFAAANGDDDRLPPKERVVYLESGGEAAVVPHPVLRERGEVVVELAGRSFTVTWAPGVASPLDAASVADGVEIGAARVTEGGSPVAFHEPFWFAVAAFRPDVRIVR